MLFRVVDHYELEYNKKEVINDCFICFENENKLLKLKTQKYYIKNCNCDSWVHESCLHEWFKNCKQCPICRKKMCKKTFTSDSIQHVNKGKFYLIYYFLFFLHKYSKIISKYLFFIYFIYCSLDSYIIIKKNYYQNTYHDNYYYPIEYFNNSNYRLF